MKSSAVQLSVAGLAFLLISAVQAKANVFLLIDDYDERPIALHLIDPLGVVQNSSIQITQEGVGALGTADVHFEYISSTPLAVGQTVTTNYNIFENPLQPQLSDTWNITATGITPVLGDLANVSVEAHFRSDSLDGVSPTALFGGISVSEDLTLGLPSGQPDGTYQYVTSPLADLTTGFNSAPEPSFFALVGVGMAGMLGYRFRRRKQS